MRAAVPSSSTNSTTSPVTTPALPLGTYRHYKGQYYQVIGSAKHSETEEVLVVYYCLYHNPSGQLWVRPLKMFTEMVEVDGEEVLRFTWEGY